MRVRLGIGYVYCKREFVLEHSEDGQGRVLCIQVKKEIT